VRPQIGLIPIGENPVTGLWEFVHLQSGGEPMLDGDGLALRHDNGNLHLTPDTGIVFVLVPGRGYGDGIYLTELAPYFISKYELTQRQWDRLAVSRGAVDSRDLEGMPATNISWNDINAMWGRELGWCTFPSELQWEHACRGDRATRWWPGDDPQCLIGVANVLHESELHAETARLQPVGLLLPNPFGLHDVHGNVREWCGDTHEASTRMRFGDGLRDEGVNMTHRRVLRGGCYGEGASFAGSAFKASNIPGSRSPSDGVRPVRGVTP